MNLLPWAETWCQLSALEKIYIQYYGGVFLEEMYENFVGTCNVHVL